MNPIMEGPVEVAAIATVCPGAFMVKVVWVRAPGA
jgi:hypothetical protein